MLKVWLHRLAHLVGWNHGTVETWWEGRRLMVGFRCVCGELSSVSPTAKQWSDDLIESRKAVGLDMPWWGRDDATDRP